MPSYVPAEFKGTKLPDLRINLIHTGVGTDRHVQIMNLISALTPSLLNSTTTFLYTHPSTSEIIEITTEGANVGKTERGLVWWREELERRELEDVDEFDFGFGDGEEDEDEDEDDFIVRPPPKKRTRPPTRSPTRPHTRPSTRSPPRPPTRPPQFSDSDSPLSDSPDDDFFDF